MRYIVPLIVVWVSACQHPFPRPQSIQPGQMMLDLGGRWTAMFPESPRVGLLAPRFGIPALVQRGRPFAIEIAERGGPLDVKAVLVRPDLSQGEVAHCLASNPPDRKECVPLDLVETGRLALIPGLARRTLSATPHIPLPEGRRSWDLALAVDGDQPQRAHRAVWIFDTDPSKPRKLRIAQLSDLHLGKTHYEDQVQSNLAKAIHEVNAIRPDLVLVTGDLVEQGRDASLEQRVAEMLHTIDVPVVVIIGNHDYGHFPKVRNASQTDDGYFNFARAFHPNRTIRFHFGGWTFYGFDTGPSVFSLRILTRGLDEQAIEAIDAVLDESQAAGVRGVILFSHAPSRTILSSDGKGGGALDGCCGHMLYGAVSFEERLRRAAARGLRVFHLSGHTHWSDVFEWREDGTGGGHFERWRHDELAAGRMVRGKLVLVNTPAVTFAGSRTIRHAGRFGFVVIDLDERGSRVAYRFLEH